MIQYPLHHPLSRLIRNANWYACIAGFFFFGTLITSHWKTNYTFHPPYSSAETVLYIEFLAWLVLHKLFITSILFILAHALKSVPWAVLGAISILEVPECILFYDRAWFYMQLFDLPIPICCDSFTICTFSYMIFIKPIFRWRT